VTESAESVRLGFATVDVDREHRQGLPEVVYGSGKSAVEIAAIVSVLLELSAGPVLVTRVDPGEAAVVQASVGSGSYDEAARLLVWRPSPDLGFRAAVVTAGFRLGITMARPKRAAVKFSTEASAAPSRK